MLIDDTCALCVDAGGELLFEGERLRVVAVGGAEGAAYRGYCRLVWNAHVKELTDLSQADRGDFMDAVYRLEQALRESLRPDKINLASLGNLTPHLHWHVIPRFSDDAAYPKPIWAQPLAATSGGHVARLGDGAWRDAVRHAFSDWPVSSNVRQGE